MYKRVKRTGHPTQARIVCLKMSFKNEAHNSQNRIQKGDPGQENTGYQWPVSVHSSSTPPSSIPIMKSLHDVKMSVVGTRLPSRFKQETVLVNRFTAID
jgi:hypothetical protein